MREYQWSVTEAARNLRWPERKIRRRLARARFEVLRPERWCACGCGRSLAEGTTAAGRYASDTCRNRAYRARRASGR